MDTQKFFKPYPIPERKPVADNHNATLAPFADISEDPGIAHSSFVEIEMDLPVESLAAVPVPQPQYVYTATNDIRALFYTMRQIALDSYYSYSETSKVFYQQAVLMKNFEDNYNRNEPFFSYYPYYQKMDYDQLRTYFTWRTQARNGNIAKTSVSYAFLYIYELLNNIGVADPQEGLDKLMSFWNSFRLYDLVIDRYMLQWIKDYHIYYPLTHSFREFAEIHNLQKNFPTVFGYESGQSDSFDLYAGISKYNIKKSIFYSDQSREILNDCFYFILNRLRILCKNKKKLFEDFVFYPFKTESNWTPFSGALFYPVFRQADRQVVLSEKEMYNCHQNQWTYTSVMLTEHGKHLIGYIMKDMEANLRMVFKFKYKLTADMKVCDSKTLKKFEQMKISLPKMIQKSVAEFYFNYTRKEVTVDLSNLIRIREEALNIQEKLIVPENIETIDIEPVHHENASAPSTTLSDAWPSFLTELTQIEFEALTMIMNKNDINRFAREKGVMIEVLLDSINQKATDYIGDTILSIDGSVTIFEEYEERLTELLR